MVLNSEWLQINYLNQLNHVLAFYCIPLLSNTYIKKDYITERIDEQC